MKNYRHVYCFIALLVLFFGSSLNAAKRYYDTQQIYDEFWRKKDVHPSDSRVGHPVTTGLSPHLDKILSTYHILSVDRSLEINTNKGVIVIYVTYEPGFFSWMFSTVLTRSVLKLAREAFVLEANLVSKLKAKAAEKDKFAYWVTIRVTFEACKQIQHALAQCQQR